MSNKIFVSYKYYDINVYQNPDMDKIQNPSPFYYDENVTPCSYLNYLSSVLSDYAIEKWEKDDEDLSEFQDETIASKLKDKIYDSTITIVLISPKMKDAYKYERDQWIPWEVSYSLKEITRNGRTSKTNAMIAVVLPDLQNKYDYCIEQTTCCTTLKFSNFFTIIGNNFFNKKNAETYQCRECGDKHYRGLDSHYFAYAKWIEFISNPKKYIDEALIHQANMSQYKLHKDL